MSLVSCRVFGWGVVRGDAGCRRILRGGTRHPLVDQVVTAADSTETAVKSGSPWAIGPDARFEIAG